MCNDNRSDIMDQAPLTPNQLRQIAAEEECLGRGIEAYRKRNVGAEVHSPPGQAIVRRSVEPLMKAITLWVEEAKSGRATKLAKRVNLIEAIDRDLLALVTATACLQAALTEASLQTTALQITRVLESQMDYENLRETDPQLHRKLRRALSKIDSAPVRLAVLRQFGKRATVVTIPWSREERVSAGTLLIELFAQGTGLIEVTTLTRRQGAKNVSWHQLQPTEELRSWMLRGHALAEVMCPLHMPMVSPPVPWTGPRQGGYLTPALQMDLVKGASPHYRKELSAAREAMSTVYSALNAVQATPWRINEGVLRVLDECWDRELPVAGLPSRSLEDLPPKLFGDEPAKDDPVFLAWKAQAAAIHQRNDAGRAARLIVSRQIGLAKRFQDEPSIWFVHNLDWRGRMYANGAFLSPQGDDLGKALLQFADGKPLGEGGAWWLAVHGANCYGIDKVRFDDRVAWVIEHHDDILASALDPISNRWWAETQDNPWMFLAFCLEWAALALWEASGRARCDFVSHLAIGLDGSCNGLQNFSAALRDEVGGAAVNLIPGQAPSDIYQMVANHAAAQVEQDAQQGSPVAQMWRGKVSRKIAKRPTMTMPYGSKAFGFCSQIEQTIEDMYRQSGKRMFDAEWDLHPLSWYLAGVMQQAINKTVVKAREAMDWLQAVAAAVVSEELPVTWTAPSGMPVYQAYRAQISKRLDFAVVGRRYQLVVKSAGTKLDKARQLSGIAPNYVHSLDAAHLVATVNACLGHGPTHFAMVHDSYGTHAGDVDVLAHMLRRSFVEQYREDVFAAFREEVLAQLTDPKTAEQVPPVPAFGTLDLDAVMDSEYFFA